MEYSLNQADGLSEAKHMHSAQRAAANLISRLKCQAVQVVAQALCLNRVNIGMGHHYMCLVMGIKNFFKGMALVPFLLTG